MNKKIKLDLVLSWTDNANKLGRLHIYFHAVLNWIETASKTIFKKKNPEDAVFVNVQQRMQWLEAFMNFGEKINK